MNASPSGPRLNSPASLSWALLSVALALPWLLATHTAPWTTFHADAALAVALLPLAVWVTATCPGRWPLTWPHLTLALVALLPIVQLASEQHTYRADALLASLYVGGFALAALVGAQAEATHPERTPDTLFTSFAIAAIASVGLVLYQWLNVEGLGMLVLPLPLGRRPVANLGQPNLLATLLVWGLLALWWGRARGQLSPAVAVAAAAFLLVGTAATQSRAGALQVAVVALAACVGPRAPRLLGRTAVLALLAWFVACSLVWPGLSGALQLEPALSLEHHVDPGRRLQIWALALDLIAQRPLFGWGWNEGATAQLALADSGPALHLVTPYMHNLLLDLLVWNGVPLGLLIFAALAVWFVNRWRHHAPAERPLLLALTVLLLHALLELPHAYAIFLLPAGLMLGVLETRAARPAVMRVPRALIGSLVALLALTLAVVVVDYFRVEADFRDTRMRNSRVGDLTPVPAPRLWLLAPFGELLEVLRIEPATGLDPTTLQLMRRVAERFPSASNLFHYAQAAALNNQPDEARRSLRLLCHLSRPDQCQAAGEAWRSLAETRHPVLAAVTPPRQ